MGYAAAAGRVAGAVAPFILDAMGNEIRNPALNRPMTTADAEAARDRNNSWAAGRSAQQLADENRAYVERDRWNRASQRTDNEVAARLANEGSNLSTARLMASNAAQALNDQYMTAGQRLNDASSNSQRAANDAMATIAGMFR